MIRIGIDARESGTSTGRYVDKLIEHLHGLKPPYEIVVLTKNHRVAFMKDIAPDFEVVRSDYREFTFNEQYGLVWQLYGLRLDLVHFGMTHQPILYFGKSVTTVHDLTTARFRNPAKNWLVFKFKQLVYKWVIRRVARKSKAVITPSRYVKDDLASFAKIDPAKIEVIHEAADKITDSPLPLAKLKGKRFLLYVGRPLPHKNLKRLVEAYGQLRQKQPELRLVLVGRYDVHYRQLSKFAAKKGVEGLLFTDFMSEAQLRWLYKHATVYVFPSLSEGFGLPPLEAMQYGLPVVASKATCIPEICKDAALYFDPLNVDDMTATISLVLDDPKLAKQLAEKGDKLVGTYSWDKAAEQTLDIYKKALKRP